ncbi:MAG: DUF1330 domain-containing protein [Betaproteobacteria bacterium HGW-Betaproteobacteria-10]|jgi:uncharacterized protein (DUF1330 family)|nr:MAG: DUF1330 domain-containing protein [Betaproteobacteria bacterium HGW-Betaproteobacteria-10]
MKQKGYLIAEAKVSTQGAYEMYESLTQAAIAQYGGRYLVDAGAVEILEGQWSKPPRLVIVEFDSVDQARCFYQSPEYQFARKARQGVAETNMLVVAGMADPV